MDSNPYSPPRTAVDTGPGRGDVPFHLTVVALGLATWGLFRLLSVIVALAAVGTAGMPLWLYYLALLPPLLCLCAAYVLRRQSSWFIALVVAVPLLSLALTLSTGRPVITLAPSYFGQLLERVPPWQVAQALGALALVVYGGFLRKWGWLR